ncbi:MAG: 2-oxoacid:acceptor oxidoreductase subunit alpha [Desulfobacterales bacterium]
MDIDTTVKVSGEAGQGIQTVGQLLGLVCREAGLYVMAISDFESRIRGGSSFFQIRISNQPVRAPHHRVDLLVALTSETLELYRNELSPDGLALIGNDSAPIDSNTQQVLFTALASQAGGRIYANTVAAGACLALLGAPLDLCQTIFSGHFRPRGKAITDNNLNAVLLGYEAVKDIPYSGRFTWPHDGPRGALVDGARAIALGALAGDCRLAAFYPMSPATAIMQHLDGFSDAFPLVVEQAEDEIAAANIAIGASFAGVRSMTATSGGGFCLMTEALGLAGITETPLVIVNAQRPGPATGLPTRTAQADLLFVIHAGQDEFPRFVFAPGSPAEAFEVTVRAFHLAEKYQVPVIILVDQYLADATFIVEESLTAPDHIERFIVGDKDMKDPAGYERFAVTPSGVSPRALPCRGKALVVVTGNEHSRDGHISESISDRISMVDKRHAKLDGMREDICPPRAYHGTAEILLIGWGSTEGAIAESVDRMRADGIDAGCLMFTDLWPFPADAAAEAIGEGRTTLVVEQNRSGQLGKLIREQTGIACSGAILKYDGRPMYPHEIVDGVLPFVR